MSSSLEKTGNFLFRYRSYIPVLTVVLFAVGLLQFHYPHGSHRYDMLWEILCVSIALLGLSLRFYIVSNVPRGTSGRNTKKQKAETLNTTGMYSIVRHPLYLANFIIWFSISLFLREVWFTTIFTTCFLIFYAPVMFAEEKFLERKFGDAYCKWKKSTPKFIPRFSAWTPPSYTFSLRKGIKSEYHTFFAIAVTYMLMEVIGDYKVTNTIEFDPAWVILFSISVVIYLTVRFIVKKTSLLSNR